MFGTLGCVWTPCFARWNSRPKTPRPCQREDACDKLLPVMNQPELALESTLPLSPSPDTPPNAAAPLSLQLSSHAISRALPSLRLSLCGCPSVLLPCTYGLIVRCFCCVCESHDVSSCCILRCICLFRCFWLSIQRWQKFFRELFLMVCATSSWSATR